MTQMCLILLLGHILANTGPVRKLLTWLARVPGNATFAYVFVFVVAALASLITWGLGLVVGALLAREIAVQSRERGIKVHFPLLVAAGYSGFVVWHMGYSGSGPLTAATPDSFLSESLGGQTIPVSETIFAGWNLLAIARRHHRLWSPLLPCRTQGRRHRLRTPRLGELGEAVRGRRRGRHPRRPHRRLTQCSPSSSASLSSPTSSSTSPRAGD
jgi:hypothetical protein